MALNAVQQRTLDYLSSGDGTVESRQQALNDLIQRGFFAPDVDESFSVNAVTDYANVKRDSPGFCGEGVTRFLNHATGQPDNSDKVATVAVYAGSINFEFDEPYTDAMVGQAFSAVINGINLLRGQGWRVTGADMDWEYSDE